MTFGQIKTITENYLLSSYNNKDNFKVALLEFKKDVLNNRNISKIYSIYEDLSTPQGLNEKDANLFIDEGVKLIQTFLTEVKLPKMKFVESINNYKEIDNLVYIQEKFSGLKNRIEDRKKILETLMKPKKSNQENLKIPISSMVSIANKKIKEYVDTLDESSRKEVYNILSENKESLKTKFEILKTNSIQKLESLLESQGEESKNAITETIQKIKSEEFNHINFYKLKKLSETL